MPVDVLFCNADFGGSRGMAPRSFDYAERESLLRANLIGTAAVIEALTENVAASRRKDRGRDVARGMALPSAGWAKAGIGEPVEPVAPLAPEVSVRGLRNVIARLRPEDSEKFFSCDGSTIPW